MRELAGPEEIGAPTMARGVAVARKLKVKVLGVPMPIAGLRSGLLPGPEVATDARRFSDWLDACSGQELRGSGPQ